MFCVRVESVVDVEQFAVTSNQLFSSCSTHIVFCSGYGAYPDTERMTWLIYEAKLPRALQEASSGRRWMVTQLGFFLVFECLA